jgi:hypothetical protein
LGRSNACAIEFKAFLAGTHAERTSELTEAMNAAEVPV